MDHLLSEEFYIQSLTLPMGHLKAQIPVSYSPDP